MPPITPHNHFLERLLHLERRKGGGDGHSSSGHSSSESDGDSDSSSTSSSSTLVSSSGNKFSSDTGSKLFAASEASKAFEITSGTASPYSEGGGSKFTLAKGLPFAGTEAGGGTRVDIFGTSRIGSGYIYGVNGSYISGRPFPYVFIPVAFAADYYGSEDYENVSNRPGGNITSAIIQPLNNTVDPVTYRIIGDKSSVEAVYTALILNCSIVNSTSTILPYSPNLTAYPQPEQVVQWYRASTFALTLDEYNNSAASYANMPSSSSIPALPLSSDTPLPSTLNHTFLECLNQTIGAAAPLIDIDTGKHITISEISEIATVAIFGLGILYVLVRFCAPCCFSSCCGASRRSKPRSKHHDFKPMKMVEEKSKSVFSGNGYISKPDFVKLKYPSIAYGSH